MTLLVTGSNGLLGTALLKEARARGVSVVGAGRAEADVTRPAEVRRLVGSVGPTVVIHCAAYTGVDGAERDRDLAMSVNRDGTRHVAEAARSAGARLVCVSTDYVFDGARATPYPPDHPVAPLSHYGATKLEGERAATAAAPGALVARVSWLYGATRRNFVTAMLERARRGEPLEVVADEVGGPSWTYDVSAALLDLVEVGVSGVYHVANRGGCSRADLVRAALRLAGLDAPVRDVSSEQWGAPARRPAYSVLDVSATERAIGRPLPTWQDALARFLTTVPAEGGERAAV